MLGDREKLELFFRSDPRVLATIGDLDVRLVAKAIGDVFWDRFDKELSYNESGLFYIDGLGKFEGILGRIKHRLYLNIANLRRCRKMGYKQQEEKLLEDFRICWKQYKSLLTIHDQRRAKSKIKKEKWQVK